MKTDVSTKTVLITGVSRGIGRCLAAGFISKGYRVIGLGRTEQCDIEGIHYFQFDLENTSDIESLIGKIKRDFGVIDILINNAAINPSIKPVALSRLPELRSTFEVNFFAAAALCMSVVKQMSRKRWGRIINIGSMAIAHEVKGESAYTSSKSALKAYTRVLAKEVYGLGILVNMVCPSAIPTELMGKIDPQALDEVLKRNAIPSCGTPEDVFDACFWLCQDSANSVTGQVIYLGGV